MGTRALVKFKQGKSVEAVIYKHHDGYPESEQGMEAGFRSFFADVRKESPRDTRFGDPSYLAARYVVWLSRRGNGLSFTGVGVAVPENDYGVAYVYEVACSHNETEPVVTWSE